MRTHLFVASFLILADLTGAAQAEMRSDAADTPLFTAADAGLIARNGVLSAIVESDPWLVRQILDLAARESPPSSKPAVSDSGSEPERRDAAGSMEWIRLLKRAKLEKAAQGQGGARAPEPRSAVESVRWIELIKAAKAKKTAVP